MADHAAGGDRSVGDDRRRGDLRDLLGRDHQYGAGRNGETDPELGDADPRFPPERRRLREGS